MAAKKHGQDKTKDKKSGKITKYDKKSLNFLNYKLKNTINFRAVSKVWKVVVRPNW